MRHEAWSMGLFWNPELAVGLKKLSQADARQARVWLGRGEAEARQRPGRGQALARLWPGFGQAEARIWPGRGQAESRQRPGRA